MFDPYFRVSPSGDKRLMDVKRAISTEQGGGAALRIQLSLVGSYY